MISFKGRHFEREIILMTVRWYVAYSLSYRDIEELMLERGLDVEHTTVHRWVVTYSPELENKFSQQYKRKVGVSWRMDETYIKIKGEWYYLPVPCGYIVLSIKVGTRLILCCQKNATSLQRGLFLTNPSVQTDGLKR